MLKMKGTTSCKCLLCLSQYVNHPVPEVNKVIIKLEPHQYANIE